MSSIAVRKLDPAIKERLRVRAAEQGHSMEAEVRRILQVALASSTPEPEPNPYERVHARFAAIDGVELDLPAREQCKLR